MLEVIDIFCSFQETFCPTEEQKKKRKERVKRLIKQSYDEKWCCTCINYIPVDDRLPGFVTAYPECKLGGLATDNCENYIKR